MAQLFTERQFTTLPSSGGVTDHGLLTGLGDNDHPQYFLVTNHTKAAHDALALDHGLLTGLADDDHAQYHNDARGDLRYLKLAGGTLTGNVFLSSSGRFQTGQTSFTREPWAASTISLGDYGYIGSQGSFALSMAWNFERGTDSGWYSLGVNSYVSAGAIEIGNNGIVFRFDETYGATTLPGIKGQISTLGSWSFGSSSAGKGLIQNAAGSTSLPTYSYVGDTDTGWSWRAANEMKAICAATEIMWVRTDGVYFRVMTGTGFAANTYVNGSGLLMRVTSSKRFKTKISYDVEYLADYELQATLHYREDSDMWFFGLIAEDVYDLNPILGVHDDQDRVENYDTRGVIAILVEKSRRDDKRISALESSLGL